MNKQAATELVNKAKEYVGRTIHVHVVDKNNEVKESVECTFVDWGGISMREDQGEPIYQLTANMKETSGTRTHRAPLSAVVREFERDDQRKK